MRAMTSIIISRCRQI